MAAASATSEAESFGQLKPSENGGKDENSTSDLDHNTLLFKLLSKIDTVAYRDVLLLLKRNMREKDGVQPFNGYESGRIPLVYFEIIGQILGEPKEEVCLECLQLIAVANTQLGEDLDEAMLYILPRILALLNRNSPRLKEAVIQVLQTYMRHTYNWQHFLQAFIQNGIENPDISIRKGCLNSINSIFTFEFANENLILLIESLMKLLVSGDTRILYQTLNAIRYLSNTIGPPVFHFYLKQLDDSLGTLYQRILYQISNEFSRTHANDDEGSSNDNYILTGTRIEPNQSPPKRVTYSYGIFESSIVNKLKSTDWRARVQGTEQLKMTIANTTDLAPLAYHLDNFFALLSKLMEDTCFKVVIVTLDVYELIIRRMKHKLTRHIRAIVSTLVRYLGDMRVVIKEQSIKVIHKLMCETHPKVVLDILLEQRNSRNPRIREEILNRATAAILTYPSYNFEFSSLANAVVPALIDRRRRVRLSAMECVAVMAQTLGPSKVAPLLAAVDQVEIMNEEEGLHLAVQSRMARKILPRCTADGMVNYSITIPSSASPHSHTSTIGADVDWILTATGSTGNTTPNANRGQETTPPNRKVKEEHDQEQVFENASVPCLPEEHKDSTPETDIGIQDCENEEKLENSKEGGVEGDNTSSDFPKSSQSPNPSPFPLKPILARGSLSSPSRNTNKAMPRLVRSVPTTARNLRDEITLIDDKEKLDLGSIVNHLVTLKRSKSLEVIDKGKGAPVALFNGKPVLAKVSSPTKRRAPVTPVAEVNGDDDVKPTEISLVQKEVIEVVEEKSVLTENVQEIQENSESEILRKSSSETSVHQLVRKPSETNLERRKSISLRSSKIRPPQIRRNPTRQKSDSSIKSTSSSIQILEDSSTPNSTTDSGTSIPYTSPNEAIKSSLRLLSDSEWNKKMDGLKLIQSVVTHHPASVMNQLHTIVSAIALEVKNLRSSLSRSAVTTLGFFFTKLKKGMEPELDLVTQALLHKSGENTGFIRDDVNKALYQMVENITNQKAALSLLIGGGSHRNDNVRKTTSQFVSVVVESMGAPRCLTGKDIPQNLLPVSANFIMDRIPLTRYYGRRIFSVLLTHPDFWRILKRHVSSSKVNNILNILENVRRKGPGEMP